MSRNLFVDVIRIWKLGKEPRIAILGSAVVRSLTIVFLLYLIEMMQDPEDWFTNLGIPFISGGLIGSLLTWLQPHPRRILGLIPIASLGITLVLVLAIYTDISVTTLILCFGIMSGLMLTPLTKSYQHALSANLLGIGIAFRLLVEALVIILIVSIFYCLDLGPTRRLEVMTLIATFGTCYLFWAFLREFIEFVAEGVYALMYRFRAVGPGLENFPRQGPVIVIANHSSWLDPTWLGKVLPRSLTPMMTSLFFDQPLMRWLMVYVIGAIRVQYTRFRRDVPELKEAIAALDRGQCLVLFPEGELRKRLETPIKRFGQGIFHILIARPQTPVVVCWIEGGWGSYFSYFNGPPTKNKRFDLRHSISIAVGQAQILNPDLLADQKQTRQFLMLECLRMRQHLGLPELTAEPIEDEPNDMAPVK